MSPAVHAWAGAVVDTPAGQRAGRGAGAQSARVGVAAVGVLAPGLAGWPAAHEVLSGAAPFTPDTVVPAPSDLLAPAARRRLNVNARWALAMVSEALAMRPEIPRDDIRCGFASADGDGDVLAQTLAAIAAPPVVMSPTLFHNSVLNAAAGYCSIAHRLTGASTTLCAGELTFGAALLEAFDQVLLESAPVLCVIVDTTFPRSLAALRGCVPSCACALLLTPETEGSHAAFGSIALVAAVPQAAPAAAGSTAANAALPAWLAGADGATSAAALPLLAAIARNVRAAVDFTYPGGDLVVDYRPR